MAMNLGSANGSEMGDEQSSKTGTIVAACVILRVNVI